MYEIATGSELRILGKVETNDRLRNAGPFETFEEATISLCFIEQLIKKTVQDCLPMMNLREEKHFENRTVLVYSGMINGIEMTRATYESVIVKIDDAVANEKG